MNKLLCLLCLAFYISQEQTYTYPESEDAVKLKHFKVGLDFNSEYEIEIDGESVDGDLENGISIGFELLMPDTKFLIGLEYLFPTEVEDGAFEVSHISFYGLVPLISSNSDSDFEIFGKLGYSMLDMDVDGADVDLDTSGGLMYGFQLELSNFGFSYTIHNGEYEFDLDFYNDYYGGDLPSYDTKTSRFTMSYHL